MTICRFEIQTGCFMIDHQSEIKYIVIKKKKLSHNLRQNSGRMFSDFAEYINLIDIPCNIHTRHRSRKGFYRCDKLHTDLLQELTRSVIRIPITRLAI